MSWQKDATSSTCNRNRPATNLDVSYIAVIKLSPVDAHEAANTGNSDEPLYEVALIRADTLIKNLL